MANNGGEGLILTTNIYKSPNDAAIFPPEKRNPEENSDVKTEGLAVKQQVKKQVTWKININEIHIKLGHTVEDRICATVNNLQYGEISVFGTWFGFGKFGILGDRI